MKRSAPTGGYSAYGSKKEYRRQVWATFRKLIGKEALGRMGVMLMPSSEGDEIKVALSRGASEERMIAVDKNAALLASAQWRKDFPRVRVYGSEIVRAAERMAKDGVKLGAVNLDLCGCSSAKLRSDLEGFAFSGVLADRAWVAITILRGREVRAETAGLEYWSEVAAEVGLDVKVAESLIGNRNLNARDVARMGRVASAFCGRAGRFWKPERLAVYRSNRSTMLWWVMETADREKAFVKVDDEKMKRLHSEFKAAVDDAMPLFDIVDNYYPDGRADIKTQLEYLRVCDVSKKKLARIKKISDDLWESAVAPGRQYDGWVGVTKTVKAQGELLSGSMGSETIRQALAPVGGDWSNARSAEYFKKMGLDHV